MDHSYIERAVKKRYVYSVRRARKNLLDAVRNEWLAERNPHFASATGTTRTRLVAAREQAIRDLIASVRAERRK